MLQTHERNPISFRGEVEAPARAAGRTLGTESPDTIRALTLPHTIRKVPAWTTLLGIALFGIALWWLHHVIGQYRWQDILAHMRAIRSSQLGSAILLTAAGYGVLTLYDALGLRFAGARLPYPRLALVSFMGYAIGHNVGVNTLSGGAIRFRAYSMLGLSPKQIATVVAFGTLTFALGSAALLGLSLLSEAALSGSVLHMHRSLIVLAGCMLLVGVMAYLVLACSRHEPLRWRKFVIPIPSPRIAFAQIGVASGDLLCAAGVLFSLLPAQAHIGYAPARPCSSSPSPPASSAMCRGASAFSSPSCCSCSERCRPMSCSARYSRIASSTI
jgi:uncharacterized membrane protein YbhN (UPF0104 family)